MRFYFKDVVINLLSILNNGSPYWSSYKKAVILQSYVWMIFLLLGNSYEECENKCKLENLLFYAFPLYMLILRVLQTIVEDAAKEIGHHNHGTHVFISKKHVKFISLEVH